MHFFTDRNEKGSTVETRHALSLQPNETRHALSLLNIRNLDQIRKHPRSGNSCTGTVAFDEHW